VADGDLGAVTVAQTVVDGQLVYERA
jgi:hypothetical protein